MSLIFPMTLLVALVGHITGSFLIPALLVLEVFWSAVLDMVGSFPVLFSSVLLMECIPLWVRLFFPSMYIIFLKYLL